jgi:hypothetical protein
LQQQIRLVIFLYHYLYVFQIVLHYNSFFKYVILLLNKWIQIISRLVEPMHDVNSALFNLQIKVPVLPHQTRKVGRTYVFIFFLNNSFMFISHVYFFFIISRMKAKKNLLLNNHMVIALA